MLYTIHAPLILSSVSVEGGFSDFGSTFIQFMQYISSAEYNTVILVSNIIFLAICFIFRYRAYFKIEDFEKIEDKNIKDRYKSYAISHTNISALFAFVVCCILVMLVNSNINIIWNLIIAPLIGFLASIWFDNNILVNYENKFKFLENPLSEIEDEKDNKKENGASNIHVTINNGESSDTNDKFVLNEDRKLSDDEKIEATINRIIDVQKSQSIILNKHTEELKEQNIMLKSMQRLMKNNIKFELEDMIYECLDRGYVTPSEDKKIRIKYNDYVANNGNTDNDLKDLYESRYLDLEVHNNSHRQKSTHSISQN